MIVKIIHHKNMKRSMSYLYEKKVNDPMNAGIYSKYSMQDSKKEFLNSLNTLMDKRFDLTKRESKLNNQIKHLIVSCHPKDAEQFEINREELLGKLFKELKILPENHLTNIFIHNDTVHPHMHILFSRIGEDLSVLDEGNLGYRLGTFAEETSKEYGFAFKSELPRITFSRKDLYRPNERTALLKLLEFALCEAQSVNHYRDILQAHHVKMTIEKDGIVYSIPNPKMISKDTISQKIKEVKSSSQSREEYKKRLLESGIVVKWDKFDKEIFSTRPYLVFPEKKMPKIARSTHLFESIKNNNHSKEFLKIKEDISIGIDKCETLGDLQELLPGSKMRYKIIGNRIENISFEYQGMFIRLQETFDKDVQVQAHEACMPLDIPIIFSPRFHDLHEEQKQLQALKSNKYKRKQLGFKVKI